MKGSLTPKSAHEGGGYPARCAFTVSGMGPRCTVEEVLQVKLWGFSYVKRQLDRSIRMKTWCCET